MTALLHPEAGLESSLVDADDKRVTEIAALFEANGWRLHLEEVDGVWEATFAINDITIGQMLPAPEAQAATRLEAAEAAWAKSQDEPWLGRDDRPA
jgi:hypothetical protein